MTIIVNGAPHYVDLFTRDSGGRQLLRLATEYPQHLPKWYIFAKKGQGGTDWFGTGTERENEFGAESFQERSAFFTHQTRGANVAMAVANSSVLHRIIPFDSGPASNLTLWIDLLPSVVDDYERNEDGSIKVVGTSPVIIDQIPGYKYQLIMTHDRTLGEAEDFTTRKQRQGTMVDPANPTARSTQYPLLGFQASSRGKWGDDSGMAMYGLNYTQDAIPERLVETERCYPYALRMYNRDLALGTVNTERGALGTEVMNFVLKPRAVDVTTNRDMYLARSFSDTYFQRDTRYPLAKPSLSNMVIFQNNIDAVLESLYEAEKPYIDVNFHDFNANGGNEKYLFNLFGGHTLSGYLYRTFVPMVGGLSMNRNQIIYASGGSDGTMTNDVLAKGAVADVRRYGDLNDSYQNKAWNIENHMYDTGWLLEHKYEFANFISKRGDTFVTFGTFQEGERQFDQLEEFSIGSAIKARLANMPESTYFGTSVVRAGIYCGDAEWRGSTSGDRVSSVLEVLHKRAKYMGASNGRWKNGSAYDQGAPGSVCEILHSFNNLWLPVSVRYRYWDAGINWWTNMDREQNFCPSFRTVYSDDTSPLTADTVAMALIFLNRVNDQSWRVHAGTTGVEAPVFLRRVQDFINSRVANRIDNRYAVEPVPSISSYDEQLGYAWHSGINLFADPQRTVAVNYTEVFRASDRGNAAALGATFE